MVTLYPMRALRLAAVGALVGGIGLVAGATAAWAAPTLSASPSTGLTNGQTITLSGSGFTAGSAGNLLECNNAPNEPTVALGSPVNNSLAVGCSGVGYTANALTAANSSGAVNKSFQVSTGTVGPPCGKTGDVVATCPATDSAGHSPAADAANYPCPPTQAQQAAGVVCQITFGNQANESASVTVLFQGESSPTTTAAPTASTSPPTTAAATAPTNSLANTGPGPALWAMALAGMALVLAAAGIELTVRRRLAGTRGPPSS